MRPTLTFSDVFSGVHQKNKCRQSLRCPWGFPVNIGVRTESGRSAEPSSRCPGPVLSVETPGSPQPNHLRKTEPWGPSMLCATSAATGERLFVREPSPTPGHVHAPEQPVSRFLGAGDGVPSTGRSSPAQSAERGDTQRCRLRPKPCRSGGRRTS